MKKPITYLITTQVLILASVASLLFSSCIIVHPDDEIIVEKKSTTVETTTTTPSTPAATHSITCKNQTSLTVTDWCVKKDNIVTFANSGNNRSIRPYGGEDMITDLPEGYYKVYFSFNNEYQLDPDDYFSSDSVYLDKDVTYCLYERASSYAVECRSAGSLPDLYLKGSDGTEIPLVK